MFGWLKKRKKKRGGKKKYPTYRKHAPTLESRGGRSTSHARKKPKAKKSVRKTRHFSFFGLIRPLMMPVGIVLGIFMLYFWLSLPSISHLDELAKARSIVIKSESGATLGNYGDVYGDYIKYRDLPESLINAVLATEDRNFFYHFGVDPIGIARAMVANLRAGHVVQGGSTITQQLAKNLFLTPERTMSRKFREVLLAIRLELRYSKEEILTMYLNRVYLGAGNYGVDAASRRYFNKTARELSLPESAILAGLLKAPSRFAPTSNPDLAQNRAYQVLLNMQDAEFLKSAQVKQAREKLPMVLKSASKSSQSNLYFTDWIVDQLPEYIGSIEDDLVVTTTLNPDWQNMASQAIQKVLDEEGKEKNAEQAALVAMATDGAVRALVGGRDYGKSQYNRATQSHRQPGSSFKLFVYLNALEQGLSPESLVDDQPITIGKWSPQNYTGKYEGLIPLKEAVAKSLNSVAVQVSEQFGRGNVIAMARRLGVESPIMPTPSLALGANEVSPLELATAYAHLPAGGREVRPYGITEIRTVKGTLLYLREAPQRNQLLSEPVVAMMNELLSGVIESGTGRSAGIGRPAAGKTGTTSDYKDAWFAGYVPQLTTIVWVGNDNATPMKRVTGGNLPAHIWRAFMRDALAGSPAMHLPRSHGEGDGETLPWLKNTTQGWPFFSETSPPVEPVQRTELPTRAQPEPAPNSTPAPQPATKPVPANDDFELGDSFWKALREAAPQN